MAKLIVVNRELLEASRHTLEKLLAKSPEMRRETEELNHFIAKEKTRRDKEYVAQSSEDSGKESV
jgi:hypothetical protein